MKNKKIITFGAFLAASLFFWFNGWSPEAKADTQVISEQITSENTSGASQPIDIYYYTGGCMLEIYNKLITLGYTDTEIQTNLPVFYSVKQNPSPGSCITGFNYSSFISKSGDIIADTKQLIQLTINDSIDRRGQMMNHITTGIANKNSLRCSQKDNYIYNFIYEINKENAWTSITNSNVNKCQNMRMTFTPSAEWFSNFEYIPNLYSITYVDSPATEFLACSSESDCLTKAKEYDMGNNTFAKGVQAVPANWVDNTQKSLAGSDATIKCASGLCMAYASGQYSLISKVAASTYYGQCRGFDSTVKVPPVAIPEKSSNLAVNVINRPPTTSVSFANTNVTPGQSTVVTCDAVDPDSCVDKISKIKWTCFNSQGQQTNCYFGAPDGSWRVGGLTEEIATASMTNPYRATVNFKGTSEGAYAVACEAFDNDFNVSGGGSSSGASGYGVGGVNVCTGANCGGTNGDNTSGVVPDKMNFCAVLTDQGSSKTVCGSSAKINMQAYVASTIKADQYKWTCGNNDTAQVTNSDKQECSYTGAGIFTPTLSIHDSESGNWVSCVSQAKAKITGDNKGTCSIGIREAGTTNDFVSSLNVTKGTEVEAKVSRECLGKADATWTPTNGSLTSENKDNDSAKFKFPTAGIGSVSASIGTTSCGKANLTISEEVNIR